MKSIFRAIVRPIKVSYRTALMGLVAVNIGEGDRPGGSSGGGQGSAGGGGSAPSVDIGNVNKTVQVIGNAANAIAVILFALSAIFIIVSGFLYLTAAGNQDQLKRAKDTLIYAIVGIVLGLIAFSVDSLVPDILK